MSNRPVRWWVRIVAVLVFILATFAVTALRQSGHVGRGRIPISFDGIRLSINDVSIAKLGSQPVIDGDLFRSIQSIAISGASEVAARCGMEDCPSVADFSIVPALQSHPLDPRNLIWSGRCDVDISSAAVRVLPGESGGCSMGGLIDTWETSPARIKGRERTSAPHEVTAGSTIRWNSASSVELRLQASTIRGQPIIDDAGRIVAFRGELAVPISYRPKWHTVCEADRGEAVRAAAAIDGRLLAGGIRFSDDGSAVSLSLLPTDSLRICDDAECRAHRSACHPILFNKDVLYDWTTLLLAGIATAAGLLALRRGTVACVLLAALAASAVSCTGSAGSRVRISLAGNAETRVATGKPHSSGSPLVLLLAAGATCQPNSDDSSRDIQNVAAKEVEHFTHSGVAFEAIAATASGVEQTIRRLSAAGSLRRGLVLYYTGHAEVRQNLPNGSPRLSAGSSEPQSNVCLDRWVPVGDIISWVNEERANIPWAVLILDACESAFVDLSKVSIPLSVLAASPEPIAVYTAQYAPAVAPFARAVAAVLASPDKHDPNRDGMVTDRELLDAVTAALGVGVDANPLAPRPRLQRQAPSALPVRFYDRDSTQDAEFVGLATLARKLSWSRDTARRALAKALEDQMRLPTGQSLPISPWDFVVTNESIATVPCAGDESEVQTRSCIAGRPDLRRWPAEIADRAPSIARFSTALEVYAIERVEGWSRWYDIIRLRDGRIMASTTQSPIALVPARTSVLARTLEGEWLVRTTGAIPRSPVDCRGQMPDACEAWSRNRHFTVCEEEEGQCFTATK